jgi:hypothetical protein
LSRKIAFAGTLVSLFCCPREDSLDEYLVGEFLKPPLARFAQIHDRLEPELLPRVAEILEIAERFGVLLADRGFRETAKAVSERSQLDGNDRVRAAREDARRLQTALEAIFFDSALLSEKSRHYLGF